MQTVTLSNAMLSDLFFNHQNANYAALFAPKDANPSREEMEEAINEDAKDFAEILSNQVDAAALAADFLKRL